MDLALTAPRDVVRRYQNLVDAGPQGQVVKYFRDLATWGRAAASVFETGRADLFVRRVENRLLFSCLPASLKLPTVLTLRPPYDAAPKIEIEGEDGQAYVSVDRCVTRKGTVSFEGVEEAALTLAAGGACRCLGIPLPDGRFLLEDRWFPRSVPLLVAARERGETHLLLRLHRPLLTFPEPTADEITVRSPYVPDTRRAMEQRLFKTIPPEELVRRIMESSVHPQLLAGFSTHLRPAEPPPLPRHLYFLERIIRTGFAQNGRPLPPAKTPVAVVGFGDDLKTIQMLASLGYPVTAVEVLNDTYGTRMRELFSGHRAIDGARLFDYRDPELPIGQMRVVLMAAAADEAAETLARLPAVGGIVAVTEFGRIGKLQDNLDVDIPSAFCDFAKPLGFEFETVYVDQLDGRSALFSYYRGLRGQSVWIARRISY